MKKFIIPSLLFALNTLASPYIVEMDRVLSDKEIQLARKKGLQIELFDQTQTDYFRKTYRIEASSETLIANNFPVKTLETVHRAQYFSLEPKSHSKFLRPDELFHFQWGLHNQGQTIKKLIGNTKEVSIKGKAGADIRWAEAIKKIETGMKREPLVAVVDMGIDLDHPELKDRLFRNEIECNEKGEVADSDEDRDKNGLKGDCIGWNFAGRSMYEARRPYDDDGHGTHVAGIIAAETNKTGISGVSSKIKILPVKVTGKIDETSDRKGIQPLTDRIAKGILYAANMGADVINLSLGWTRSMDTKYLNEALNYALGRGVIIVAAAGNNNNNASIFPCAHYDVICVGAATIDGSLADFSNYGGEVDVLAPGDEIVSTIPWQSIPLQLNLQGYDIRSGTSQATPFVSALAALIRGNFPRLHRDEVTRRIVDSADPGIPGKSLGGMINMKGAFEIEALPSVRPAFKNFSVALYDAPTNKFLYPLNLKNFGFEAKDVVIKIRSMTDSYRSEQEFTYASIRPGEVITLRMEGEVLNPKAHNQIQFEVTIKASNMKEKSFRHEFRMARDILRDERITTVGFEYETNALPVGSIRDGVVRNLINTVETVNSQIGLPEYYLPRFAKETNSIEVRILRESEGKLKEVTGFMSLPGATQLLNVMTLDLNYDGIKDYMVRAIACEKDCEDPKKALRYIQYSLWTKELKPLIGKKSIFKFLPTLVNVDLKSQRFLKVQTDDFGTLAMPVFIETGIVPLAQQNVGAFSRPDSTMARRIYFLEPSVNEEGLPELVTKTVSTTEFIESIRQNVKALPHDEVQAMHLLSQTSGEISQGTVRAVLSVGKGYLRKNIELTLGEHSLPEPYTIKQNLWGYEHLDSLDLVTKEPADSFVGLVSRSRLVMFQNSFNKSYLYDAKDDVEAPLASIASFVDENNEYTFFQTPSYLMLAHHTASGLDVSRLKINRFSFLPGTLFNDTFYPVLARNGSDYLPALYVDETDIQSNLVSITTYIDGVLRSPMELSAFIPPGCRAMNPVRLEEDEGHSLSLLCVENKQWVMKFVRLNQ